MHPSHTSAQPLMLPAKTAYLAVLCLLFTLNAPAQRVNNSNAAPHRPSSGPNNHFIVVIDAAHGGSDLGARLSPTLDEKSITLALAINLRTMLAAHGISTVMTRTNDTDPSMATRAGIANHAHASACLILHATATGVGIHLFTSSLTQTKPGPIIHWSTAQSAYINQSVRLSSDVDAAFEHTSIPVIIGRTFLQPLDNLTCPAITIELAPQPSRGLSSAKSVDNPTYQSTVLKALVAGILQWRQDWSRQP